MIDDPLAAGRNWLAALPRAPTAHAARGHDPLAPVRRLLAALGDPHERLRVIHIAGSKGKGSTALFTEALLRRLGRRTFTYTSPHLERWTERFRIAGRESDADTALASLEAVRAATERTGVTPGFFEALTVAGFDLAARQGVEWAVIETGVGGRADATNVVRPEMTILTGIEREHVDRLGNTLEAIATEKAGIIKPGAAVVVPELPPGPRDVVRGAAERAGVERIELHRAHRPIPSPLPESGAQWHCESSSLTVAGTGWALRARLAAGGPVMGGNAALALTAIARLGLVSIEALDAAAGVFAETPLPGRMETVSTRPWVIIDGAHTPASARAVARAVADLGAARVHLLVSLSAGKERDAVLAELLPLATAVTATRADADYSLDTGTLAAAVRQRRPELSPAAIDAPAAALTAACADAPGETLVLATGSVYLAGRVRAAFHTAKQQGKRLYDPRMGASDTRK